MADNYRPAVEVSETERKALVQEYLEGIEQIAPFARSRNISPSSFHKWVLKYSDQTLAVGSKLSVDQEQRLLEMWRTKDYTQAQLAKMFSVSGKYVARVLNNRGVTGANLHNKYEEHFPQKMVQYFTERYDALEEADKKKFNKLPSWEMFAIKELDVDPATLKRWVDKGLSQEKADEVPEGEIDYRPMAKAYEICSVIYEEILINGGANNMYQPLILLFVMKNRTRLKDVKAVELTGKDGKDLIQGTDMSKKKMDDLEKELGILGSTVSEISDDDAIHIIKNSKMSSDS